MTNVLETIWILLKAGIEGHKKIIKEIIELCLF